jgi:hypothetical protein
MIKSKSKLKNEIMQILFWHFAFGIATANRADNADASQSERRPHRFSQIFILARR